MTETESNAATNQASRWRGARWFRRLIAGGVILVLVVGAGWTFRVAWLPFLARWLDVGQLPRHVDYVMSLPGDENYRPFTAAAMIRLQLADQVLVSQTEASPEILDGFAMPTAELLDRIYEYCDVPAARRTVLSGESGSTAGDIGVLAAFMRSHPQATVAVVTSDYHTRRSWWTLQKVLGDSADRLTIVSAPNGDFETDRWWRTENGFLCITSEYIKLVAYWFVYGNGLWWLAGGAGVVVVWMVWRRGRRN